MIWKNWSNLISRNYTERMFSELLFMHNSFFPSSQKAGELFSPAKNQKELDADRRLFREKVIAVREFERKYRIVMSEIPEYTARLISN